MMKNEHGKMMMMMGNEKMMGMMMGAMMNAAQGDSTSMMNMCKKIMDNPQMMGMMHQMMRNP